MTKTVGITGTRNGCTELQHDTLSKRLYHLYNKRGYTHLVHGDCVGVDTQAHMSKKKKLKKEIKQLKQQLTWRENENDPF